MWRSGQGGIQNSNSHPFGHSKQITGLSISKMAHIVIFHMANCLPFMSKIQSKSGCIVSFLNSIKKSPKAEGEPEIEKQIDRDG